jgi:hypothetical protein
LINVIPAKAGIQYCTIVCNIANNGLNLYSGKDSGAIEMSSQILIALEKIRELAVDEIDKTTLEKYNSGELELLRLKVLKKKRGSYDKIKLTFDRKSLIMKEYNVC